MVGLALGIDYLTGYAVATHPADREAAEWPPHPARVFMALAAAHFETGEAVAERSALEWLEELGPPAIYATDADERTVVTSFVPVNDKSETKKWATLQSAPGMPRSRQPRTFPRVRPQYSRVYLHWADSTPPLETAHALDGLCAKVARIGHSSSLVQMWCTNTDQAPPPNRVPSDSRGDVRLRIPSPGILRYLERQYNRDNLERFYELAEAIQQASGKKAKDQAQAQFEAEFGERWKKSTPPPASHRPVISLWHGYRKEADRSQKPRGGALESNFLVLRLTPEDSTYRSLALTSTLQLTQAVRGAWLNAAESLGLDPIPQVLTGHGADGAPSSRPHLAPLPLGFVGHEHADGHLMGLGLAMPQPEYWPEHRTEREIVMMVLARLQRMTLGPLDTWTLEPELREAPPRSLIPQQWTAAPNGAAGWTTVTPIAADRHAKGRDPQRREAETAAMVMRACEHAGLPQPQQVFPRLAPEVSGVPHARQFPALTRKDGSKRRHTHAVIVFDEPVTGPIAIGAGRYRGYGLCYPLPLETL